MHAIKVNEKYKFKLIAKVEVDKYCKEIHRDVHMLFDTRNPLIIKCLAIHDIKFLLKIFIWQNVNKLQIT